MLSRSTPMTCDEPAKAAQMSGRQTADTQRARPASAAKRQQNHHATSVVHDGSVAQRDMLHAVLWGGDIALITHLAQYASDNIRKTAGDATGARATNVAKKAALGIDWARAVFLLLLNVDPVSKAAACAGVPEFGMVPFSEPQAAGFFVMLSDNVVPDWQRNEFTTVQDLITAARQAYLVA